MWSCSACTYLNEHASARVCEVCDTPRQDADLDRDSVDDDDDDDDVLVSDSKAFLASKESIDPVKHDLQQSGLRPLAALRRAADNSRRHTVEITEPHDSATGRGGPSEAAGWVGEAVEAAAATVAATANVGPSSTSDTTGITNQLLHDLHFARLRRQQQRQASTVRDVLEVQRVEEKAVDAGGDVADSAHSELLRQLHLEKQQGQEQHQQQQQQEAHLPSNRRHEQGRPMGSDATTGRTAEHRNSVMVTASSQKGRKRKASDSSRQDDDDESTEADKEKLAGQQPGRKPRAGKKSAQQTARAVEAKREDSEAGESEAPGGGAGAGGSDLVVLTYNVWFNEEVQLEARMAAIADAIRQHRPHVVCMQEVTRRIFTLLTQSPALAAYTLPFPPSRSADYFCLIFSRLPVSSSSRLPFSNSLMGRELLTAVVEVPEMASPLASSSSGMGSPMNACHVAVATTHLESPCPAPPIRQMFSEERVEQARQAVDVLEGGRESKGEEEAEGKKGKRRPAEGKRGTSEGRESGGKYSDVIFCGDMNWDDKREGTMALPAHWMDAWLQLRPNEPGFTYDCKMNPVLGGGRLRLRLDRFLCCLPSYELVNIDMVGTQAITGVHYAKQRKVKGLQTVVQLPVLPSDHFGLLLQLRRKG